MTNVPTMTPAPRKAANSRALGRRTPKNAPALRLGHLLRGTVPTPPSSVDYGTDFTGWQVLGNDVAGDCVAVTWANQRALVTTALTGSTQYPSQDEVWSLYQTQNPTFDPNGTASTNGPGSSADNGMDIQTVLEYLTNTGGPDGVKAVAFARVDYTNEDELRAAHAIFGQVWYGVTVLWMNQDEFNANQAWDYVAGAPVDGGHSITGVGYDPTDYRFVTWGRETEWTENYRANLVDEAWVVIWPEHLGSTEFQAGIDLQTLADDYQAITGSTLPLPPPPPVQPSISSAGRIASSQQFGLGNQTDVFAVDNSGQLNVFWVDSAGAWNGPEPIGPAGLNPAQACVSASQQFGLSNQTDVFAVDNTGTLNVFWVDSAGAWNGPEPIGPAGFAPAGAAVVASQQFGLGNQTDVFVVDNSGQLAVFWVDSAGAWNGPEPIGPAGFAPAGAPLAASQQFGIDNQTDVFVVDNTGTLNVFWVDSAGAWNGPEPIGATGFASAGAALAASQQFGLSNQTDVFVVDATGTLNVFWVDSAGAWNGPEPIGPNGFAPSGAALSASEQFGLGNQTDVFVVDSTGTLNVFWVDSAGAWNGPEAIGRAE